MKEVRSNDMLFRNPMSVKPLRLRPSNPVKFCKITHERVGPVQSTTVHSRGMTGEETKQVIDEVIK